MDPELKDLLRLNTKAIEANTRAQGGGIGGGGGKKKDDEDKGGVLGTVKSVIKGFVGGVAVATAALFAISKFVEAINPGQALLFNMAMKDLTATIGVGLVPVLALMSGVINEVSGILLPLSQQLSPILVMLANTVGNILIPWLRAGAEQFAAMIPALAIVTRVVEVLGGVVRVLVQAAAAFVPVLAASLILFEVLEPALNVVVTILGELVDVIGLVITIFSIAMRAATAAITAFASDTFGDGANIAATIKEFGSAVKQMVVQLAILGVSFAKFIGATTFVDKFKKGLEDATNRVKGARAVGAMDPSIEGIAGISNKIALSAASAQAGTGARKDTTEDLLKDILKGMEGMTGDTLEQTITKAIRNALPGSKTVEKVEKVFSPETSTMDRLSTIAEIAYSPFTLVPNAIIDLVSGD